MQALAIDEPVTSTKSEASKDLTFLVGSWESTDQGVPFTESWSLAGDNQLKGLYILFLNTENNQKRI